MTQNTNSGANPDNARDFDDIDVPTYDPKASQPTLSFAAAQPGSVSDPQPAAQADTTAFPATAATAAAMPQIADPVAVPANPELRDGPTPEEVKAAARAEKAEARKADPRRGTIDFGLLFVRIALSVWLIVAGVATFFGLGDGGGLAGLEKDFADYAMPQVLAIAVPTLQLLAGAFLLLGLVTPLAAMLGLVVTGFTAIHALSTSGAGLDVFSWPESVWLSVVLFLINIAVQFTGPGVISLDFSRSWARRPLATSWIFVVLGVAALVAVWWFGAGVNPLS